MREMEIYDNNYVDSDDDYATVRGDDSEAELHDFPTFTNDDNNVDNVNNIINCGIKRVRSNSSLEDTFNNHDDELSKYKPMDYTMENTNVNIIDSIDNNDDFSSITSDNSSSDSDYNINDGDYNISITVNTKPEPKKSIKGGTSSKKQSILKSNNTDNYNDNDKNKYMKPKKVVIKKNDMSKNRRLTRSSNDDKESLDFQSKNYIPNNNKRRFIYKLNEIDKDDIFARDRAGQTNLHRACQEGNLDRVKELINKGSDIDACDNAGWTSLHEAAYHGYLDIVNFLLENGAEVNAISYVELDTPLHDACAEGHEDIIKALLEYGADTEKTNMNEKKPGDYTTDKNIIKLLGTPVEVVKTPIKKSNFVYSNGKESSLVSVKGNNNIAENDKGKSESEDKEDSDDDIQTKRPIILETNDKIKLRQRGFANKKKSFKRPEYKKSVQKKSSITNPINNSKNNNNNNHHNNIDNNNNSNNNSSGDGSKNNNAIIKNNSGNSRSVRSKFSNNDVLRMDLKSRDFSGRSQLHIHAKKGNMEMVGNLIEAGAKINNTDNHRRTPLHEAAYEGHYEIVNILVAMGANINATDDKFNTPLHDSVKNGHTSVVEILLLNNARPNEKNIDDKTPLDLAKCRKDIVGLLCKALHLNPENYLYPIANNIINDQIMKEAKTESQEEIIESEVKEVLIDNSSNLMNFNNTFEEHPHTPEYLKMEIKDKYSGPLYTVQLNTKIPGYPLAASIIPPSGTLFVVDLQVELILNLKANTLIQLYPNLINRSISLMEKERLWPLLRSMIWAPSKSINPSEVVALEDQRKSKFLEVQMHFIKYEEAIKDELKNFCLTTVELDISDYPNVIDDKSASINRSDYNSIEIENSSKFNALTLPLTPISPTAHAEFLFN